MNFFTTTISDSVYPIVNKVLSSTFLSEGKYVEEFENLLTEKLGLVNPVAVNSGTAALHMGLIASGVGPGDEVIIPAQTFIATGLAVLYCGAVPVFADIRYETGNIDPKSIEEKITPKTKAIIPVHWAGYPCDMDEINKLAAVHNISVIEDAAHALGAEYKGRKIGSISKFTAFSFQAIKHLTTGDGGAICCASDEDYERCKNIRWFGIDRKNSASSILGERKYDLNEIGYKYHMNNLSAAVGIGNLDVIDKVSNRRKEISEYYRENLSGLEEIHLLHYKNDRNSAWWLFTLLVNNRDHFAEEMKKRNIPVSVVHQRIDNNSIFRHCQSKLPNQEKFDQHQIALPLHSDLTDEEIETVVRAVKEILS